MEKEDLIDKLTEIFRTELEDDNLILSDELSANDVDNWDSLTHMLLISEVENSFNIKFRVKELIKINNVGKLINIISSKIRNKSSN